MSIFLHLTLYAITHYIKHIFDLKTVNAILCAVFKCDTNQVLRVTKNVDVLNMNSNCRKRQPRKSKWLSATQMFRSKLST